MPMNSRFTRILAALVILALAVPAVAQVTEDDLRRARSEVERVLADAQDLNDRIEESISLGYRLEAEIENLQTSILHAQVQLAEAKVRLEQVAVEMYMASASGISTALFFNTGDNEYQAGMEYLQRVSGSDENLIDQLRSFQNQLDHQTERLADASAEQTIVAAELQDMMVQLHEDLAGAQGFYDVLVEQKRKEDEERRLEEERRAEERRIFLATSTTQAATTTTLAGTTTTRAGTTTTQGGPTTTQAATTTSQSEGTTTTTGQPPPTGGGGACPVDGPTVFSDTWGAPRSGGRAHQGVDMRAARGTPLVAIYDSRVWRTNPVDTGLGGITVWLERPNGDRFYYAHLHGLANISVGQQVSEGQLIGYVGSTGNADDAWPHLHFEFHPAGRGPVNPYPLVRSLC